MNHRLLFRVTTPAVAVGLLLFAACFASVRYINRLQANLAVVVSDSVASMQAAHELEVRVRQLRFHSLLYLMDPTPLRLDPVEEDQRLFEKALDSAKRASRSEEEKACVREIEARYEWYRKEQAGLRRDVAHGKPLTDYPKTNDAHPARFVVEPCQELVRINQAKMDRTVQDSKSVSQEGFLAMLFLGLAGPVGGLVTGYGVSRGLKQSIYRLSVRVQDMAQRLEQDVGSVSVVADGDFQSLDRQMQHIVRQLETVALRLQQQQRELLRAEQLAAVGQLAAGIAHEVRNPLTGIKMLVEAALQERNPHLLNAQDLRVIHGEIAKLELTVQGFLNLARLPAPQRSPCDPFEVVRQAGDLVRGRAEQQHVELAIRSPEQPVIAPLDSGQIGTVFVNLFLNALDAMPGGGRIEVSLNRLSGSLQITVADTGAGIPAGILDRLFTPFVTTKATGTGLGLSLSARILEEHGGTLTGSNRPEGGARFVLTLPALPEGDNHGDMP